MYVLQMYNFMIFLKFSEIKKVHELKSIDYKNREIVFIEKAPQAIIEQVLLFAQLIID